MTLRTTTIWTGLFSALTFAAALTAAAAPGVAAQRLPDSLARTSLPSDPADFPAKVAAGEISVMSMFRAGCPTYGGYAAAAYDALVQAAETDFGLRKKVVGDVGARLSTIAIMAADGKETVCAVDTPLFEALFVKWVRREREEGLLLDFSSEPILSNRILSRLGSAKEPETHSFVRDIALDTMVYEKVRVDAARAMANQRSGGIIRWRAPGSLRERHLEAVEAILDEYVEETPYGLTWSRLPGEWVTFARIYLGGFCRMKYGYEISNVSCPKSP